VLARLLHLSLSWRPGETLTCAQTEEAAHSALEALGKANAKAISVAYNEDYQQVHICRRFRKPGWRHAGSCQSPGGTAMASTAEGGEEEAVGVNTDRV